MSSNKKIISKELGDQLRSVTFSSNNTTLENAIQETRQDLKEKELAAQSEKQIVLPASLTKRTVTVEYLSKLEKAVATDARYETVKNFSHLVSNVSLVLLSVSIITYLVFYLINPQTLSLISFLILSFEAFTLLGVTLYATSKTTTLKELRDIAASDLSTCSHIIGYQREDIYNFPTSVDSVTTVNE